MPRSFLGVDMQAEYLHAMANPPKRVANDNDMIYARAYMYTAIGMQPMADQMRPPRNTPAYAWWRAGVDTARNDLSRIRTEHGSARAIPLLHGAAINDNDQAPFGIKHAIQRSFGEFGIAVLPARPANDNESMSGTEVKRLLDFLHESPGSA